MTASIMLTTCVCLYLFTLVLLAIRHGQLFSTSEGGVSRESTLHAAFIQGAGIASFGVTLLLPYQFKHTDGLSRCGLRVVCFFYGCKLLDLALCRSETPPSLKPGLNYHPATYIWRLLAEMRYRSFDIAIEQKGRPIAGQPRPIAVPLAAAFTLGVLDYALPLTEVKCICLLLLLQVAFEGLHAVVHPGCRYPLFYRPFSASSMGTFWTTHWHACAAPFLYSLGYKPGKRLFGRWFGVLATFCLSGLWHGWAAAGLLDDSYHAWVLGGQVWGLFMLFGLVSLAERGIWGEQQGGITQRIVIWAIPVLAAGKCFRTLERHTSIAWLRQ